MGNRRKATGFVISVRHCQFVQGSDKTYKPIASAAALSERHTGWQYTLHCFYGARSPDLSLRGPIGAVAISCNSLRFRRWLSCAPDGYCEIATSASGLLAMTNQGHFRSAMVCANLQLPMALPTRKGHAASVRRQSRQRLRSERRHRRNRCLPFYRQPVRIGSIAPDSAVCSPVSSGT